MILRVLYYKRMERFVSEPILRQSIDNLPEPIFEPIIAISFPSQSEGKHIESLPDVLYIDEPVSGHLCDTAACMFSRCSSVRSKLGGVSSNCF